MDRTSAPNYATDSNGHRIYQDRNLSTGVAGTGLVAADRTAIQEELMTVIEGAGLVGNAALNNQMLAALRLLFAAVPSAAAGVGQWTSPTVNAGPSGSVVLPNGGTWAWFVYNGGPYTAGQGQSFAGVAAGGAAVVTAGVTLAGTINDCGGVCWRIA